MSRRTRFLPWYATTLLVLVGFVETGRLVGPLETEQERVELEGVVMAVPPKPETRREDAAGNTRSETYSWERCESMPKTYADTCFAALARQLAARDPAGGLEACEQVTLGELRWECIADVSETHAPIDVERSRAICQTIPSSKWEDQCVFGIAMAWVHLDAAFALETCEASGRWKAFCRHDVNGERAVVDPEASVAYCRQLEGRKRVTCWHGVGKYIGRVDPSAALRVCEAAPLESDLRGQCVHGVGWAAAEQSGPAALPLCDDLGPMRDSCILGVAYQSKRYNPEQAASLCMKAESSEERTHCLEFVRRTGVKRVELPTSP